MQRDRNASRNRVAYGSSILNKYSLILFSHKKVVSAILSLLYSVFIIPLYQAIAFNPVINTRHQLFEASVLKIAFAVLLYILVYNLLTFIEKIKNRDRFTISWLKFTALYGVILSVLFVAIYPGFWVYDELLVLQGAQNYTALEWQHVYTSAYHTFCLYLIPSGVGVVIIQGVIASLSVGYITAKIKVLVQSKYAYWVVFCLFLFIPVLINDLYPLRLTIYSYMLTLLLFRLLLIYLGKIKVHRPYREFLVGSLLVAILMFWRLEGFVYFLILPLLAYKLGLLSVKNIRSLNTVTVFCAALIMILLSLTISQKTKDPAYELTGTLNPLVYILNNNPNPKNLDKNLAKINKVINVQALLGGKPQVDGLGNFASIIRPDFESHMDEYYSGYAHILNDNKRLFLNARYMAFQHTNSIGGFSATIEPTERWNDPVYSQLFNDFYAHNLFSEPLNRSVKLNVSRFLLMAKTNMSLNKMAPYVWTTIPTLVLCVAVGLFALMRRQFIWTALVLLIVAHSLLIFLTAPATFFMYYLPIYMAGNLITALYVIFHIVPLVKARKIKR